MIFWLIEQFWQQQEVKTFTKFDWLFWDYFEFALTIKRGQVPLSFDRASLEEFDQTLNVFDFLVRAKFDYCWLKAEL